MMMSFLRAGSRNSDPHGRLSSLITVCVNATILFLCVCCCFFCFFFCHCAVEISRPKCFHNNVSSKLKFTYYEIKHILTKMCVSFNSIQCAISSLRS